MAVLVSLWVLLLVAQVANGGRVPSFEQLGLSAVAWMLATKLAHDDGPSRGLGCGLRSQGRRGDYGRAIVVWRAISRLRLSHFI